MLGLLAQFTEVNSEFTTSDGPSTDACFFFTFTQHSGVLRGHGSTQTQVAVKQLKDVDNQAALLAEARLMGRISPHFNVVRFFGVSQWGDLLNLVVEYVPDGSLDEYLREHIEELPITVLIDMCKNVASGTPLSYAGCFVC